MMSVVSVIFWYPSRNDGGPHRNCILCPGDALTKIIYGDLHPIFLGK